MAWLIQSPTKSYHTKNQFHYITNIIRRYCVIIYISHFGLLISVHFPPDPYLYSKVPTFYAKIPDFYVNISLFGFKYARTLCGKVPEGCLWSVDNDGARDTWAMGEGGGSWLQNKCASVQTILFWCVQFILASWRPSPNPSPATIPAEDWES